MKKIGVFLMVILFIFGGIAYADLNDGLIAYYPFNGNSYDLSGYENDAIDYGSVSYELGKLGKAASFDGVDDYFQIATTESLRSVNYSVSFWIKTDTTRERISLFSALYRNGQGNNSGYQINLGHNSSKYPEFKGKILSELMTSSTGNWGAKSTDIVNDGEWYHITVTYDGLISRIYINGNLNATLNPNDYSQYNPGDVRWNSPFHDLYIGKNGENGRTNYVLYDGLIDELYVYNRALSDSEVQTLYEKPECPADSGNTQADLDAQFEAGKQYCKNNPSECDLYSETDVKAEYNKGFEEGKKTCNGPCPSIDEGCAVLEDNLDISVPCIDVFGNELPIYLEKTVNKEDPFGFYWKLNLE